MRFFRGRNISFHTRLFLSFLLVTSFSVGIIALFSTAVSLENAKNQYELRLEYGLDAVNSMLGERISDLNLQMLHITLDSEVIAFSLQASARLPSDHYLLEKITYRYGLLKSADYVYFLFPGVENPYSIGGGLLDEEMQRRSAEDWMPRAEDDTLKFWTQPIQAGNKRYLCYLRKICAYGSGIQNARFLGYLALCIDEDVVNSEIREVFTGTNQSAQNVKLADELLLMNNDGVIYSASIPALIGDSFETVYRTNLSAANIVYDESGKRNLIAYHENPGNGFTLAAIVSYTKVSHTATAILQLTSLVILLCVMSCLLLGNLVSKRITRPVTKLTKAIDNIDENNLKSHFKPKYNDEISRLWNSFSNMTVRLRQAQDNTMRMYNRYVQAQYSALIAQINPHFLHNTLTTAIFLIENGKTEKSVEILSALSRMFRTNMQIEAVSIEIREELDYLRHYMDIQKIRYHNFQYIIDVPFDMQHLYTLKLILQPLVENAVQHGVRAKSDGGIVMIRGWLENGNAVFEVIDNGDGFSKKQAEEINASMQVPEPEKNRRGIGIKNVNDRLVFQFGNACGVQMRRENGHTVCRVTTKTWEDTENGDLRPYL